MVLYHGSPVAGLKVLQPFLSNHGKPYVYLSNNDTLALIYAHNPVPRPYSFFSYRFDDKKQLHYDEYFPDALRVIYSGQSGWVYTCEADLPVLKEMPWVYLSQTPVDVIHSRFVPDLYEELLLRQEAGQLCVHRYETLTEPMLRCIKTMGLEEIEKYGLRNKPDDPYRQFLHEHYPELI